MKKMRGIALLTASILSIFIFISCGKAAQKPEVSTKPTKGYIWEAKKGEDTVYLVGTMHPAPTNVNFFNEKINDIIEKTDSVALELDLTDSTILKEVENYQKDKYFLKNGELKDSLTEEEFKKLEVILKDYGVKYKDIKSTSVDGLLITLNNLPFTMAGFTGEVFDVQLSKKYKELNKKVISLETVKEQLDILTTNNDANILKEFINGYDKKTMIDDDIKLTKNLFKAYETSDKEFAEKEVDRYKEDPELYDKLIAKRNIKMVEKIDKMVEEKNKFMVAVGYLHFFGEDSIIKLLEEKGYKIKDIA